LPKQKFDQWNIVASEDDTSKVLDERKDRLDKIVSESNQDLFFYFDGEHSQRFYLGPSNKVELVKLSQQLAYMLGFSIKDDGTTCLNSIAKYFPDITGGLHAFYVYAPNLVENTIIGNQYGPLLRVVSVDRYSKSSNVESIYTQEFHYKVLPKHISEIRIRILSDSGNPIAFNWGNCIVTLYFQRSLF